MADLPTISVPGIGSGLDVNGIVQGLVDVRKVPFTERNDAKIATFNNQISGIGSLRSALSEWQTTLFELKLDNTFNQRSVTFANGKEPEEQKFTVTGDSSSTEGSYDIEVMQTAQAHKLTSNFAIGEFDPVGEGTMDITVGSETYSIEVSATDTLKDVKDKINDIAGESISATIVTTDSGVNLSLASKNTGEANAIEIAVTDVDGVADANGLSRLQYDTNYSANMQETSAAQDARIKIDGFLEVSSDTNKFEGAIEGVTISVKEAHPAGESDTFNLSLDKESTKEKIQSFVDAYNQMMTVVDNLTFINRDGSGNVVDSSSSDDDSTALTEEEREQQQMEREKGVLSSDATIRTMINQFRATLSDPVTTSDGTTMNLSVLGIETQTDGTLKIDETKLDDALENNFQQISEVFSGFETKDVDGNVIASSDGVADKLNNLVREYEKFGGILQTKSSSFSDSIEKLNTEQTNFDEMIARYEAQLYNQFLYLDTISAQLDNTSSYLEQQFKNLPGVAGSND
ncbi:flagellar filament capping protein FliD [Corallincola platygyrae]|uniref:Flagellar hook-associated protein 2 n=1 Tax=Corallincola platygyrae TaxID=1193278 RepID=A0ABW4XJ89_9GAMM